MPFKSEKQRRYLWLKHPDIAKRWAKEYPRQKNLPLYAHDKDDKDDQPDADSKPAEKQSQVEWHQGFAGKKLTDLLNTHFSHAPGSSMKQANSIQRYIDIPHSDEPTYAGEERAEVADSGKPVQEGGVNEPAAEKMEKSPLLQKLSAVLSRPLLQFLEDEKATQQARQAARIPQNANLKQYPVATPTIPPPMGMTQAPAPAQPAQQAPQPQQPQRAAPVGGGASPMANPINAFGALSSSGQINGNAAFGVKNSPDSLKTASSDYLGKIMNMDFPMHPDPEDLELDDEERMKTASDNTPCSCGCGDTTKTCKCSSSCSCKKPGGSCYQKPKEKNADMVKYSLEDMLKSARCWAGYEPVPGKKPFSEDSCRPVGSGKKKKKKSEKKADAPALSSTSVGNTVGGPPPGTYTGKVRVPVIDASTGRDSSGNRNVLGVTADQALAANRAAGNTAPASFPGSAPTHILAPPSRPPQAGQRTWSQFLTSQAPGKPLNAYQTRASARVNVLNASQPPVNTMIKTQSASEKEAGTPAWQRSEGKNEEGGLNEKGRKSYEREHGGNLKAPVTQKNPKGEAKKRQNSFCSRMCGMKKVNTGADTAKDPDSRINKSLRKWNCKCSSAFEFGVKLASQESPIMPTNNMQKKADALSALVGGGYGLVGGGTLGAGLGGTYGLLSGAYSAERGKKLRGALRGLGNGAIGGLAIGGGIGAGLGAGAGFTLPHGAAEYLLTDDPLHSPSAAIAAAKMNLDPGGTAATAALGAAGGGALGGLLGEIVRRKDLETRAKRQAEKQSADENAQQPTPAPKKKPKPAGGHNYMLHGGLLAGLILSKALRAGYRGHHDYNDYQSDQHYSPDMYQQSDLPDVNNDIKYAAYNFGAKMAANRRLDEIPAGAGPGQIADAVMRFNQLRALVRPDNETLKDRSLSRRGFQHELRRIATNSQGKDKYNLSQMAPNPGLRAAIAGAAGLAGTGALAYMNGAEGLGAGLAGTGLAAGGAYLHGLHQRNNFRNTSKLLRDYGLLKPELLRQAYPLLADNYRAG